MVVCNERRGRVGTRPDVTMSRRPQVALSRAWHERDAVRARTVVREGAGVVDLDRSRPVRSRQWSGLAATQINAKRRDDQRAVHGGRMSSRPCLHLLPPATVSSARSKTAACEISSQQSAPHICTNGCFSGSL